MRGVIAFMSAAIFLPFAAYAAPFTVIDNEANQVTWHATATPGFLKIDAKGGKVQGSGNFTNEIVEGKFTVRWEDFDTGISLRNRHMKDKYLNTKKYPDAILEIKPTIVHRGKFEGNLTVKDETKPVSGTFTKEGNKIEAKFSVSIKDYPGVGAPSYRLVTIGDRIDIVVSFQYRQELP